MVKVNRNANKHFDDTFDTQDVLVNEIPMQLMIIKDTDGNTYKKKIKSRHKDIIKLGDYVKWNNQIWMITLLDSDDKAWNRGYMYLCEILLRWQDDNGNIIERWGIPKITPSIVWVNRVIQQLPLVITNMGLLYL